MLSTVLDLSTTIGAPSTEAGAAALAAALRTEACQLTSLDLVSTDMAVNHASKASASQPSDLFDATI